MRKTPENVSGVSCSLLPKHVLPLSFVFRFGQQPAFQLPVQLLQLLPDLRCLRAGFL